MKITVMRIGQLGFPRILHPLQAAFVERDASQSGYCTPGQVIAGVACISEGHANSPQEIRDGMSGNICRCGSYDQIVLAIQNAARVTRTGRSERARF